MAPTPSVGMCVNPFWETNMIKAKFLRTNAFQLFSFVCRSLHTLQPTTNSTMNKYEYYAIIALCCFSARYPNRTSHHATKWRSIYCNYSDSAVSQRCNVSELVCGNVPCQYNAHLGSPYRRNNESKCNISNYMIFIHAKIVMTLNS